MPPSLAAALVAACVAASWLLLGRRRVPLLRNVDTGAVAALNRAQIALAQRGGEAFHAPVAHPWPTTQPPLAGTGGHSTALTGLGAPPAPLGRTAYRAQLETLFRGDGPARLRAVQAAHAWGDRLSLPLLRRGLRDSDPAVMRAAALAMERFRGRPAGGVVALEPQRAVAPRKVSRTR